MKLSFASGLALVGATTAALAIAAPASAAGPDQCPNAPIRALQGSAHLAECRAYERVSDVEKFGATADPIGMSTSGSRVQLLGGGGWGDPDGQDGLFNYFIAGRGADRWTVGAQNLSRATFTSTGRNVDSLPDLSRSLVLATSYEELLAGSSRFYFKDVDGSMRPASPVLTRRAGGDRVNEWITYGGAADDLSSYVFSVPASLPLLPGQAVGLSGSSIYEVRGADTASPTLRRVDVDTVGGEIGFACGRTLGGGTGAVGSITSNRNVVTSDGSKIFFSGRGAATSPTGCSAANQGPMAIYARSNGTTTTEISKSECDRVAPACAPPATSPAAARTAADSVFRGASEDGGVVWFVTNRQLANSDTDATLDLYEYRASPGAGQPHLTQISAGDGTAGPVGSGAAVLNTVRVSHDGGRAYFVAQGKLTTDVNVAGQQATAGQPNLYLWERTPAQPSGRLRFVATLSTSDSSLWASTDNVRPAALADKAGRYLVFATYQGLTADDLDAAADVYRLDAQTGGIVRVSVGRDGYDGDGNGAGFDAMVRTEDNTNPSNRKLFAATPDGSRILFSTRESLQPGDESGTPDIYEWRDGSVSLVSSGRDTSVSVAHFSMSPDGSTILFSGARSLVGDDTDTTMDTYAARVDGGFTPRIPPQQPICLGDSCQPPNVPFGDFGEVGSRSFAGPGNVSDVGKTAGKPVKPKVRTPKIRRGTSRVVLSVGVSGAGRLKVSGAGLRPVSRSVSKAGTYKTTVTLSKKARATLKRKGRLSVTARVAFTAPRAKAQASSVRLTFRATKNGGR